MITTYVSVTGSAVFKILAKTFKIAITVRNVSLILLALVNNVIFQYFSSFSWKVLVNSGLSLPVTRLKNTRLVTRSDNDTFGYSYFPWMNEE